MSDPARCPVYRCHPPTATDAFPIQSGGNPARLGDIVAMGRRNGVVAGAAMSLGVDYFDVIVHDLI